MSILVNKDSRVIVQGITGSEGTFHTEQMLAYGTNIVAGLHRGKADKKSLTAKSPCLIPWKRPGKNKSQYLNYFRPSGFRRGSDPGSHRRRT